SYLTSCLPRLVALDDQATGDLKRAMLGRASRPGRAGRSRNLRTDIRPAVPEGVLVGGGIGTVVDWGRGLVGAEERAPPWAASVRLGCEVVAIVPQDAQQLSAWWQSVSHGDPGVFEFSTQPFMFSLSYPLLAEAFGVVVEGAVPARRVEELVEGVG